MKVSHDFLLQTTKAALRELEEEWEKNPSYHPMAFLEGATQAIGRTFDHLLINNCRPSQIMQNLEVVESIHGYLSLWLKKQALKNYSRTTCAPKVHPVGAKAFSKKLSRTFPMK